MQPHLQHNAWTDGGFRVLGKRCGFLTAQGGMASPVGIPGRHRAMHENNRENMVYRTSPWWIARLSAFLGISNTFQALRDVFLAPPSQGVACCAWWMTSRWEHATRPAAPKVWRGTLVVNSTTGYRKLDHDAQTLENLSGKPEIMSW